MTLDRRGFHKFACSALAAGLARPLSGLAAEPPLPSARVVLGVNPGSLVDNVARQLGRVLQPAYAGSVTVENKTGAGGILAVSYLKTLANDGSNLYVGVSSPLTVYPVTYKKLAYDPDKDLLPVGSLGAFDLALAVGPMVPAQVKDLKGFFDWCRQHPASASFGSPGAGSMPHFIGSMTARSVGVDLRHVPYRGPGPATVDLVGGSIAAVVVPLEDVQKFVAEGKVRVLATTGETRNRFIANVPTFAEQGFEEYSMSVWIAVFVRTGTPEPRVAQLRELLKDAMARPDMQAALGRQLQLVRWGEAAALAQTIQRERETWRKAVQALSFSADS